MFFLNTSTEQVEETLEEIMQLSNNLPSLHSAVELTSPD